VGREGSGERPANSPDLPGYEILAEIGKGGMGVVYKARHLRLNRLVALKMILSGSQASDSDKARFRHEAQAVARLQHPNIVQIFDVDEHLGNSYFSLELVEGGSLADRLKAGPLSVAESARLIEVLARAVQFAHELGVVHRDLKPANILLAHRRHEDSSTSGTEEACWAGTVPKVADFGLAKTLDDDLHNTRSGMVVGTPAYMAPEQASGKGPVGPAADIWALGVLLYQASTGKLPFTGDTPMDVLVQVTQSEPLPPSRHVPSLPRDLQTVILKCLEKDPRRRYASALDLAEDLSRFLGHEPILARPVSGLERAARWVRRRPATSMLLAVASLAFFSLLGILAVQVRAEQARQEKLEAETDAAVEKARQAARRGAWSEVRAFLEEARTRVAREPGLASRREEVEALAREAEGQEAARKAFHSFVKARDDALFQASLTTDAPAQRERARQKLLDTLALMGGSGSRPPAPPSYATEEEASEVLASGYELILALAEVTARRMPRQTGREAAEAAKRGLAILEVAGRMKIRSRAYHLMRARLLGSLGLLKEPLAEEKAAAALPLQSANDHYLAGIELFRAGDLGRADDRFSAALRLQPAHFWARYFQALCHLQTDNLPAAQASLTACLMQKKDAPWIYVVRGYVLGARGKLAASEQDFQHALEILKGRGDPGIYYVLFNSRAVIRMHMGDHEGAEEDLRRAAALMPDQVQAFLSLAHSWGGWSNAEKEARPWGAAMRMMNKAVENGEAAFRRKDIESEALAELYRQRFLLATRAGDRLRAQADLEAALALEGVAPEVRARLHRERGHLLFRGGLYHAAADAFERTLALTPGDAEAWRWHGEAMLRCRKPHRASTSFTRSRELAPMPDAGTSRGRGVALLQLGLAKEAVEDFSDAISLAPRDGSLRIQRGEAHLAARAWKLAEADFDSAITLGAGGPTTLLGRGTARLRQGKAASALEDAEEAAKLKGMPPLQLVSLARLFAQIAAQPEAAEQSRRCRDQGAALIARALEATPAEQRPAFWRDAVASQAAFAPLKAHKGFAALARKYASP
jgi:tetratricopeptide (TPR) repeat protein/tRNA A-37 threonylcarbamoyl transferase component Bud32